MHTEFKEGFTLIEVLVASVIFFISVAVVAEIFANSFNREFKGQKIFKNLNIYLISIFEQENNNYLNVEFEEEEKEEELTLISTNTCTNETEEKTIKVLILTIRPSDCLKCSKIITKIMIKGDLNWL